MKRIYEINHYNNEGIDQYETSLESLIDRNDGIEGRIQRTIDVLIGLAEVLVDNGILKTEDIAHMLGLSDQFRIEGVPHYVVQSTGKVGIDEDRFKVVAETVIVDVDDNHCEKVRIVRDTVGLYQDHRSAYEARKEFSKR